MTFVLAGPDDRPSLEPIGFCTPSKEERPLELIFDLYQFCANISVKKGFRPHRQHPIQSLNDPSTAEEQHVNNATKMDAPTRSTETINGQRRRGAL
ncbi:MAG: hypothetical protein AAF224_00635 [Pseudomonadota bacterium]